MIEVGQEDEMVMAFRSKLKGRSSQGSNTQDTNESDSHGNMYDFVHNSMGHG